MMETPEEVKFIIQKLKEKKFQAFIVGGCVRDLLREVDPEDWDIATDAKPEEIGKVFLRSFSDNKFGTVTVLTGSENPKLKEIEITPFRIDEKYTDKRHPDKIKWAKNIEEDLGRRDFTVNAIAIEPETLKIIDPFSGQEDLKRKIIKAVGDPQDRFNEDALRMMRAVRLATTLGFKIEKNTEKAIEENSPLLQMISKERVRDEFLKIILSERASEGIELLRKTLLLRYIVPELEEGYGVSQNKHHIYECYEHSLFSLRYAARQGFNKNVRLAALFHDIAKPRVKEGKGLNSTFYNHEVIGAKMTIQILSRLKFPRKDIEKITKLVRFHLFYYNVDEVSDASVRRLVRKAGPESMEELLQVRMADRIGSGVPKAEPYKLRHLKYTIDKVSQDPISVKMIKVNGEDVMRILNIKPGPKVGEVLDILLGFVLEDPKNNEKEFLEKEIKKIGKLSEKKLEDLAQKARKAREVIETKRDEMTKKKYWVT
jgi:poly(A) polymerase/tRNA nucleotidyltransferase (CCA-adding enzyme)